MFTLSAGSLVSWYGVRWVFDKGRKLKNFLNKSISAGEYKSPPAYGSIITEIWGITPGAMTFFWKI